MAWSCGRVVLWISGRSGLPRRHVLARSVMFLFLLPSHVPLFVRSADGVVLEVVLHGR